MLILLQNPNLFFLACSSIILLCLIFFIRLFLHRPALFYDRLKVPQLDHSTQLENPLYRRVALYIDSLPSLHDSDYINLLSGRGHNDVVFSPAEDQPIPDTFLGARLSWLNRIDRDHTNNIVARSFVLRIKRKDKRRILKPYLHHIHTVADDAEERDREIRIHSNGNGRWRSVPFDHPANFDSLVIGQDLKTRIQLELKMFAKSKQYHHKLGRVWKRSYLLCGPSGTGKSSFIAAVANFLNYDIYNVNLWQVADDADLNALLMQSSSKSVVVVENLDRYVAENPRPRVSTSALLNFMDGLSNFQDERIMIFTMNTKEGVDSAALLRPGRIDVHIYFPLCDFNSFKNLASNYLGVKEHKLFTQVEEILESGRTMSPAEIGELMLVNRSSPSRALKTVMSALESSPRKVVPDSASSSPTAEAAWKESLPKEFRKLYGMFQLKSGKKSAFV
ncbi:AAA-ATPase-like protein [Salvia divinorum]|uniref:AAA-ATPase-like protein n=1 Tax=Salvia divinorum TaxID=28513 RepID=A0ABD1GTH8_SALDI